MSDRRPVPRAKGRKKRGGRCHADKLNTHLALLVGHDGRDALDLLDGVRGLAVGHVDAERLHERGALCGVFCFVRRGVVASAAVRRLSPPGLGDGGDPGDMGETSRRTWYSWMLRKRFCCSCAAAAEGAAAAARPPRRAAPASARSIAATTFRSGAKPCSRGVRLRFARRERGIHERGTTERETKGRRRGTRCAG